MRQDETVVAAAVEGADRVSASSIPTGVSFTLIYVQTHGLISICFKTCMAEAIKTPNSVNALPMAAYIGDFLTFVAIIALSRGGEAVARLTVTAVAACSVDAFCIALANWAILALINIFTNQQLVIIEESHWTFTSEAANHVDTYSVFTNPRDLPAFININGQASVNVNDKAGPLTSAEGSKFICAWDGTLFTGLIPGPANVIGTTAHLLGHIEEQFSITGLVISIIVSIAQTSSHIHAIISPINLHVVWRTYTGVVANGVVTCPWATNSRSLTFIYIITHSGIFIQVVTRWTAALETTKGVDTLPPLTQPWQLLALVNIF